MKVILVGVDGSAESKAAAECAATLAERLHAGLLLAFFVQGKVDGDPGNGAQDERAYGAQVLREMKARCERRGLTVATALEAGSPATGLDKLAQDTNAAMLVVGHRGHGRLSDLLVGSVADKLVQISTRPVLVHR